MTQRVSRTGRVYTEGSHGTWEDYPRDCAGCRERLRITRDAIWFEARVRANGCEAKRSWHTGCRLEATAARSLSVKPEGEAA